MKKRWVALVTAVMLAATCLAGCSGGKTNTEDYVVQIPYYTSLCSAPFHIAIEKGYFDEVGLKYSAFVENNSDLDLVVAGKADVAYDLLPTVVQRISNGLDIKAVMGAHVGCINVVAREDSGIQSIADLKGRQVGVPGSMGSDPAVMLQRMLAANGISVSADNMELSLQVYDNADLQVALENGTIEAFVSWDPYASIVAKETNNPIIWSQATDALTKEEICCIFMLRPGFLEDHPEEALKYCQAMQKACDFIRENPEEAARIQIEKGYVANDDVELNTSLLTSYHFETTVQQCKDSYVSCAKDLIALGLVDTNKTAETLAEEAFAPVPGLDEE